MSYQVQLDALQKEIAKAVKGKDAIIKAVLAAMLAGGHILLEDIPGVGKTTLALAFSRVLSMKYKRIQFTPDVLPSDITGFSMYSKQKDTFQYVEGGAMCNIFLADEINRTSPKTQSALLEVMEEGKVTVDGVTREIPKPFIVIATQNPLGSVGTQKLPESQMDRFMIRLSMGYPDRESEIKILKQEDMVASVQEIIDADAFIEMQKEVEKVFVSDVLYEYIMNLVEATRTREDFVVGISPRGSIALIKMAKAAAFLAGREYMVPSDVLEVFADVGSHRIVLSNMAKMNGMTEKQALEAVQNSFPMPV